jgi:pilus assembly protein CpaC
VPGAAAGTVGAEVRAIITGELAGASAPKLLLGRGQRSLSGAVLKLGIAIVAALCATLIDLQPGHAQSGTRLQAQNQAQAQAQTRRAQEQLENNMVRQVRIIIHKSRTVRLDQPFEKAVVGAPDVVDALPTNNQTLYLQGKKAGTTNVSIFDNTGRLVEVLDIEVTPDTASIQEKIRAGTGSPGIIVSSTGNQIVLSGVASDAAAADRAVQIVKSGSPDTAVINTMSITASSSQQVMLKVQFLEASRNGGRALGVNIYGASPPGSTNGFNTGTDRPAAGPGGTTTGVPLFGTAGTMFGSASQPFGVVLANLVNQGTRIDVVVSALETQGLIRRLAEPTLIALSGDSASFLAGGEFPVPTPAAVGSPPGIEWKKFGVELGFQPTVLAQGVINLRLTPSVSELDFANSVTISGTTIPALTKREARTTVELRDGQSFAIAGLLQANNRHNVSQLPWIGSVPVLGALFKSSAFQNNETDLVVIVTPHVVGPATPDQRLASPLDQRLPSNDLDFFLLGQMELRKRYNDYVTSGGALNGPYGHMIRGEPSHESRPPVGTRN